MSVPVPRMHTYEIELPPHGISANARVHWATGARARDQYGLHVWAVLRMVGKPAEPIDSAEICISARICRKRISQRDPLRYHYEAQYRPRDIDNLIACMKPVIDTLEREGVIAGDDAKHLRWGTVSMVDVSAHADEGISIEVYNIPAEGEGG